ncbi:MAG TPA: ABC transporter substrate-binding protein [Streptosporangiaceae bacterium]|nr:ABC transporter substrate-binding protein [Streptosporangiaceae bacterium]
MTNSPKSNRSQLSRRGFLGAAGVALGGGLASVAGCSSALKNTTSSGSSGGSGGTIKIGFISPETGELSVFTQSNAYVLGQIRSALAKGLTIGGKKYSVEIISADSQSSSARAAAVASQMVQQDSVDFFVATATPETVIPVSSQAEASGVPCVLTICPWEQWYYNSSGAANTFKYSYMYFLGTQEETNLFASVWQTASTNHVVGGLWPDDVDGAGFQKYVTKKVDSLGWKVVPSGAYTDGLSDFTPIISKFKSADVEILHAVPIPPDFITFWRQAHQNGFTPKIASISKALLFPSAADALGPLVENVMSPLWWTPAFPYKSSLDGTSASAFAASYKTATGNTWTQPMGFNYAVFEIAVAALKASGDPKNAGAVAHALSTLKGEAITGAYDFATGPVPHVSQVPELLAQWRSVSGSYQLVVINNSLLPVVPVAGSLEIL